MMVVTVQCREEVFVYPDVVRVFHTYKDPLELIALEREGMKPTIFFEKDSKIDVYEVSDT